MSELAVFPNTKGIPYFYMKSSTEELKNWVQRLKPDLIVVFSMSQLLKKNIFSIPKLGTINLHPALLPLYRGPNPDFWMCYDMDMQRGVTVHFIDECEDTGDILLQEEFEIELGMKSEQIRDIAISQIGVRLLIQVIETIESIKPMKQPLVSPTPRARNLSSSEHIDVIRWADWPIERIWHILRGTEQWLNAFSMPKSFFYRGTRWKIGAYKKITHDLVAGTVYHNKFGCKDLVACRDGYIVLYKRLCFKLTAGWWLSKLGLFDNGSALPVMKVRGGEQSQEIVSSICAIDFEKRLVA